MIWTILFYFLSQQADFKYKKKEIHAFEEDRFLENKSIKENLYFEADRR